jgi:hypothetical protein
MGVPTWSVGVIINIIGSVSINFGTNLMKFAHNEKDRQRKELELSIHDSQVAGGDQDARPEVRMPLMTVLDFLSPPQRETQCRSEIDTHIATFQTNTRPHQPSLSTHLYTFRSVTLLLLRA